jgi:hypothetical protein
MFARNRGVMRALCRADKPVSWAPHPGVASASWDTFGTEPDQMLATAGFAGTGGGRELITANTTISVKER